MALLHEWADYHRGKRLLWTLFLAYLPAILVVSLLVRWLGGSDPWLFGAFLLWAVAWVRSALQLSRFQCPACGEPFFLGRRIVGSRIGNLWARTCRHCGLRAPS